MTLDLSDARDVIDSVFADDGTRCTITVDTEGTGDDRFDETTLQLTPPTGDETTVYADGPCLARPFQSRAVSSRPIEGGESQYMGAWRLRLPTSAPLVANGAKVTFTAAPNDSTLLTRTFHVVERLGGSLSVSRIFIMEERTPGPRV